MVYSPFIETKTFMHSLSHFSSLTFSSDPLQTGSTRWREGEDGGLEDRLGGWRKDELMPHLLLPLSSLQHLPLISLHYHSPEKSGLILLPGRRDFWEGLLLPFTWENMVVDLPAFSVLKLVPPPSPYLSNNMHSVSQLPFFVRPFRQEAGRKEEGRNIILGRRRMEERPVLSLFSPHLLLQAAHSHLFQPQTSTDSPQAFL